MINDNKFIGVYTDMCAFFDNDITDVEKNKREFIANIPKWRDSGVNLVTVGLQSPCPFGEYYKKAREQNKSIDISSNSSAICPDGSLDYGFLDNAGEIIAAANKFGFFVLVNILSAAREDIFEDEYAVINGIFNAVDWLSEQNFTDILVNITDISHTFYKSSILSGDNIIKILQSVKKRAENKLFIGAGVKNISNFNEYIKSSDFIPVYAINAKSVYTTKNMLEKIYFLKEKMRETGKNIPIIMAKGDDLNDKYSSYGKNNLTEALENGISWCYYDQNGFVLLKDDIINWDKNSSPEKIKFFETVKKITEG